MTVDLMAALEIMGTGMFSLFIVMVIIAISVVVLNQMDKNENNKSI